MATADAQYQLYLASVMAIARTIVVKHNATAEAVNNSLDAQFALSQDLRYYVDWSQPTTWKYYLNWAGRYHASDTLMRVKSQDTFQMIDFTVDNLKVNDATRVAYAPGGRYYNDLVSQYPTQEQLIRGILNPVDIPTAVAARDGQILWFDATLVESNEWSLIPDLERWLMHYMDRWDISPYALVDDLYSAAFLAGMYMLIPAVILGLRLKYCFSPQTHSFHVRAFLAGHGGLDQYVDSMTKSQQLWFYRNIRYLLRNSGKQETFDKLLDHVMTERNLPLSDWSMQQDIKDLMTTGTPVPQFKRHALNLALSDNGSELRDVPQMLTAEAAVARSNNNWQTDGQLEEVSDTLAHSPSDALTTKVLESSVLDMTDASPYTLSDCLLNHWVYFASTGRYNSVVQVPNPVTGDTYSLPVKDAFIVLLYSFAEGIGLPLTTIPDVVAIKVRRPQKPKLADLKQVLDPTVVSDAQLQQLLDVMPELDRQYISIAGFNRAVRAIHQGELYQHQLFSTQGHMWVRAYMEAASFVPYQDIRLDFGTGTNFADWFAERNLDIPTLNRADQATLAQTILVRATGADLNVAESLADLQAAMIKIMQRLSSYSVQYLKSINSSPVRVLERPSIRLGDLDVVASGELQFIAPEVEILEMHGAGAMRIEHPMIGDVTAYRHEAVGASEFSVDLTVRMGNSVSVNLESVIPLPRVGVQLLTDNVYPVIPPGTVVSVDDYLPLNLMPLSQAFTTLGLAFYQLTDTDRQTLRARYQAATDANPPVALLSDTLTSVYLNTWNPGPWLVDTLTVVELQTWPIPV